MTDGPGKTQRAQTDPAAERARILNRLRRLEGQIRGLQSMIESGKDCDSVMTQVMAAKSALNRVGLLIIGYSMKSCMDVPSSATREDIVDQTLSTFLRFVDLPETGGPIENAP